MLHRRCGDDEVNVAMGMTSATAGDPEADRMVEDGVGDDEEDRLLTEDRKPGA